MWYKQGNVHAVNRPQIGPSLATVIKVQNTSSNGWIIMI
jgi:hypothetical protein